MHGLSPLLVMFMRRANISRANAEVRVFFAAASLCGQCSTLSLVESSGMMCTAGAKLILRKQHTKLTAFGARLWNAQWRQLVLSLCVWGAPFSGCRGCRGFIAENLRHCTQRCYCCSSRGSLHHRQKQQGPTTTATCYVVSHSQARGGMKPGKDLLLKCRSAE